MGFIQKPSPGSTTVGLFAPCDPRIDDASRQRCQNIVAMTAKICKKIKLPMKQRLGIYVADQVVQGEADADKVAAAFKAAGVEAICIVPDTWFYPGRTAMALTAHFPRTTPICCLAGNNAPKPGVVGVDAAVGAYAQTGQLCHAIIGTMPETGMDPEFDATTQTEIVDLVWAMVAATWLRGKRVMCADVDSMQMETALNSVHAARKYLGLESTRESMKLFADMIHADKGYDKAELRELYHWVTKVQWKDRIYTGAETISDKARSIYTNPGKYKAPKLNKGQQEKLKEELKLYLILRDYMQDVNAIGGGWTSQLAWGSDMRGIPMACADIAEALFNSTFDHTGTKPAMPFATENDFQGLVTMAVFSALTGGEPVLFADYRKVYEPWEIRRRADELDITLDENADYMRLGCIDMDNSGSGSLDWASESFLFEVYGHYFPGGGFSTGYLSPPGIDCLAGRIAYSDVNGMYTMVCDEATSVELPEAIAESFMHASSYTWPHTWLTFKNVPASINKYCCPANHIHMVQKLPKRRWQYFSDYTNVLNAEWECRTTPFIEGVDRIQPMLYRTAGGETAAKTRLAGR